MGKKIHATFKSIDRITKTAPNRRFLSAAPMTRTTLAVSVIVVSALLSACTAATATPAPTAILIPTPTPLAASVQNPPSAQPLVSVSLDPCQLVTPQEVSSLAGASLGTGTESTISDGAKICTYGSQTTNVFMVEVAQAPDIATAQQDKADFLAELQANLQQFSSQGLNITELPTFADGAVLAQASLSYGGQTINGGAMGVLKGTIFFGYSDEVVGNPAPTSAALQAEATTVLARLP